MESGMRRVLAGLMAALVLGVLPTGAFAADYNFETEVGRDWTGGYVGGSIGVALAEFDYSNCCIGPDGWTAGPLLTIQAGYNWQRDDIVYGFEGDISGHWLIAEGKGFAGDFEELGVATIRGRVGKVSGPNLFYVTAGGAFTWVQTSNSGFSTDHEIVPGFTGGIGVDTSDIPFGWNLDDQWSARAEVLYVNVPGTTLNSGPPTKGSSHNFLFKLGLNKHF